MIKNFIFKKKFIDCCENMKNHIFRTFVINKNYSKRIFSLNEFIKKDEFNPRILHIIKFCPWCGYEFPKNLEKEWKNILKNELKLTEKQIEDKQYPSEFNTDEWWIKRNL